MYLYATLKIGCIYNAFVKMFIILQFTNWKDIFLKMKVKCIEVGTQQYYALHR